MTQCSVAHRGDGVFELLHNNGVVYRAALRRQPTRTAVVPICNANEKRAVAGQLLGSVDGASYCVVHEDTPMTIIYSATYGRTPRRMHVVLGNAELVNKPPRWVESLQAFGLNFDGRVRVASVKNFVLLSGGADAVMVFGRTPDRNVYVLDYAPPLTPLLAFAIALSSLDAKCATVS
ncbi:hypothetical protein SPRG_01978 [Saprolegnia parasitica CBS 223.65]|uniref:Tubby C-terminal domain-containing protein n=1 Tax=Saprolegnia parasitica (strain CBS 223.65) TaxID=695850 RepID=A0A067D377_SAPPC|nr:hypothetical protein SPRG_01978 [Saprolegnia parasitica CBS 223.65]KDO33166.1 hypothetical protein SPRG_01978 [Saprolegnia parasitica CBS 223.65]|eukprot:XP_012195929.1 hypothetical protein SPRG_01978 [Saprolegnia parasitica CBS 223.65]